MTKNRFLWVISSHPHRTWVNSSNPHVSAKEYQTSHSSLVPYQSALACTRGLIVQQVVQQYYDLQKMVGFYLEHH